MNSEEQSKKMNHILTKCWSDEDFKRRFLADPEGTLKAEGFEVPAGLSIRALENTDKVFHLVIPIKPIELSADDLDKVAGGSFQASDEGLLGGIQRWAVGSTKFDY
jgi:Nitrile hydratase, alpha chain